MSLGFSIGDFIAVTKLTNDLRNDFARPPDQLNALSDEYACELSRAPTTNVY